MSTKPIIPIEGLFTGLADPLKLRSVYLIVSPHGWHLKTCRLSVKNDQCYPCYIGGDDDDDDWTLV